MTSPTRPRAQVTILSDTEVLITRQFDAPARLLFEASTQPAYLARWYGPRFMTLSSCEIDLRVGGGYHWALQTPDGAEFHFRGEYRELAFPERFVYTEQFLLGDQWTNPLVYVVSFQEEAGRTTLNIHTIYASKADRDGHLASGMEEGMAESHQRLDELLASLAAEA